MLENLMKPLTYLHNEQSQIEQDDHDLTSDAYPPNENESTQPRVPVIPLPDVAETPIPNIPTTRIPALPKTPLPDVLETTIPALPIISLPDVAETPIPNIPTTRIPALLISSFSDVAETPIPNIPTTHMPALPIISLPDVAETPIPNIPTTRMPALPKTPLPDVAETPISASSLPGPQPANVDPRIQERVKYNVDWLAKQARYEVRNNDSQEINDYFQINATPTSWQAVLPVDGIPQLDFPPSPLPGVPPTDGTLQLNGPLTPWPDVPPANGTLQLNGPLTPWPGVPTVNKVEQAEQYEVPSGRIAKGSGSGNKKILNAFTRSLPDNMLGQLTRFGLVGVLNTLIDVIVLDLLLWSIPTTNDGMIMLYNSLAVAAAALNSFCWNKYWTFKQHQVVTREEIMRFVCVALSSMLLNDAIMWVLAKSLPIYMMSNLLGANVLKVGAIAGTMSLSFIGMRLWVFVKRPAIQHPSRHDGNMQKSSPRSSTITFPHSLSVVLPAYNEEAAIAQTVRLVVTALSRWVKDFEIIVVNDGSKDRTRAIVEAIAAVDPRVCLINHATNQGCGAALASGFEAATKEFTFYMDSDGQFDICDLQQFFPLINEYDAVFGYRINRYDTWVRKLNAWGWNRIIRFVFGLRVRDVDCAFKLYRSEFFRSHKLEARGALLLTEIVYKFARAGYTYTQVGVHHLPRRGGKGTGAKPIVIARAFYELLIFAGKWYQEELRWLSSSKESYGYASW